MGCEVSEKKKRGVGKERSGFSVRVRVNKRITGGGGRDNKRVKGEKGEKTGRKMDKRKGHKERLRNERSEVRRKTKRKGKEERQERTRTEVGEEET